MDDKKDNVFSFSSRKKGACAYVAEKDYEDRPNKQFEDQRKQAILVCLDGIREEVIKGNIVSAAFAVVYANGNTGNSYSSGNIHWPSTLIGELECLKSRIMSNMDI